MAPSATGETLMADRTDKSSQDQPSTRTGGSQTSDPKADRVKADSPDSGDTQQPVESRPRGKTEDPDRTL
jgi:hypothetical protein